MHFPLLRFRGVAAATVALITSDVTGLAGLILAINCEEASSWLADSSSCVCKVTCAFLADFLEQAKGNYGGISTEVDLAASSSAVRVEERPRLLRRSLELPPLPPLALGFSPQSSLAFRQYLAASSR